MNTAKKHPTSDEAERFRPPLKWAGGKRWLIPHLASLYEKFSDRRLVEPFVGGMAVALGLRPKQALLNDVNPHVINFYRHLKDGLKSTIEMINDREFFFVQRSRFNTLVRDGRHDTHEAAELFFYLNRTAFNGLCRFNSKGEFNVPFGKYSSINYSRDFLGYQEVLSNWDFTCSDFEVLNIKKDDFLYIDPPYDVEFTKYSKDDFSWKDQVRLVEWLGKFDNPIVVSNQATQRILDLYQSAGFTISRISAPRRISCTGNRDRAWEMLAIKNI
jgi:DNA adenine methylase